VLLDRLIPLAPMSPQQALALPRVLGLDIIGPRLPLVPEDGTIEIVGILQVLADLDVALLRRLDIPGVVGLPLRDLLVVDLAARLLPRLLHPLAIASPLHPVDLARVLGVHPLEVVGLVLVERRPLAVEPLPMLPMPIPLPLRQALTLGLVLHLQLAQLPPEPLLAPLPPGPVLAVSCAAGGSGELAVVVVVGVAAAGPPQYFMAASRSFQNISRFARSIAAACSGVSSTNSIIPSQRAILPLQLGDGRSQGGDAAQA
jgi:hypothetical protein